MKAHTRFEIWCACLDITYWCGFSGTRLYLWLVGKAAAADYERWGYDQDPYLGNDDDGAF